MNFFRRMLAIWGVLAGTMALGLSFSLINANLNTIRLQLGATLVELQWIINIYGVFISSTLVIMGRLGDVLGRKKVYVMGNVFLMIAMLGSGFANHAKTIICFQALYGLAGAIILPISQALLVHLYPEEQKSKAIGIWASAGGITLSLGPILGGILLNYGTWRVIFLATVPIAFLGTLCTLLFVKESKTENFSKKIDWAGSFFLFTAIFTLTLAIVQSNLWPMTLTLPLCFSSLISLFILLKVEKKAAMPIIYKTLFKSRMFLVCAFENFCLIGLFWAILFLFPLYIQNVLCYSPMQTGLILLLLSLPIAIFSLISSYLYEKVGPKQLIGLGFTFLLVSGILQLQYTPHTQAWFLAFSSFLFGIGFSFIMTPTTTGALYTMSKDLAGVASGTFVTIQEIGGSFGLALIATIVRSHKDFSQGFYYGIFTMLLISLAGLLSVVFLPKRAKQTEVLQKDGLP